MSKPKRPEAVIVEFFSTAPLESVETVLGIIKAIVERRRPKPAVARKPARRATPGPVAQVG